MTAAQQRIMDRLQELGCRIAGPTAPDIPGMDGVVVEHGIGAKRLQPLWDEGYRVTPSGTRTIVEEARDAGT